MKLGIGLHGRGRGKAVGTWKVTQRPFRSVFRGG
jgi:hypothetical protein